MPWMILVSERKVKEINELRLLKSHSLMRMDGLLRSSRREDPLLLPRNMISLKRSMPRSTTKLLQKMISWIKSNFHVLYLLLLRTKKAATELNFIVKRQPHHR
jgi:hypothetical protein